MSEDAPSSLPTADLSADPSNLPLEKRIMQAYESLTTAERKLADVMRRRQSNISAYTAEELTNEAGVSKATGARLIKILGYKSFPEAKRLMRREPHWGSPLAVAPPPPDVDQDAIRAQVLRNDMANLRYTLEACDNAQLTQVVQCLADAPRIWVGGLRNGDGVAYAMVHYLTLLRHNVHKLGFETGALSFALSHIVPGDVVFLVSFRRQPKRLGKILEVLHSLQATVILLTDNSSRQERGTVLHTLYVWNFSDSPFNSFTAANALVHLVASSLHAHLGEAARSRFAQMEVITQSFDEVASLSR